MTFMSPVDMPIPEMPFSCFFGGVPGPAPCDRLACNWHDRRAPGMHIRMGQNFWWGWGGRGGVGYLSLSDRWRVTDSIDSGGWLHRVWLPVTQTSH